MAVGVKRQFPNDIRQRVGIGVDIPLVLEVSLHLIIQQKKLLKII